MSERIKPPKLNVTKDYSLFHHDPANRPLELPAHLPLKRLMDKWGFLPEFPIVCYRKNGKLYIKEGQHRHAFAEELGLPIYWIETNSDYDISEIQAGMKKWSVANYAGRWAAAGIKDYEECIAFADRYGLQMGHAAALLSGVVNASLIRRKFQDGEFRVTDRKWADSVGSMYSEIVALEKAVKSSRFLEACMAVCRVPDFEPARFIHNAKKCRDRLIAYSTRDSYLEMIEEIYNRGRQTLLGVKAAATMAMRERNVALNGKPVKGA
jgi:hypothetical protein